MTLKDDLKRSDDEATGSSTAYATAVQVRLQQLYQRVIMIEARCEFLLKKSQQMLDICTDIEIRASTSLRKLREGELRS